MKIGIIIGSTRQNRISDRLAHWAKQLAESKYPDHQWTVIDLRDYDLPLFDEPMSPMGNKNRELTEGTVRYLEAMDSVDGLIVVTPEYNHALPAVLKNAFDLLDRQLIRKPVGIISHGSVGGARANEQVRLIVNSSLGAVPIPASVTFQGRVGDLLDESGNPTVEIAVNTNKLEAQLDELVWYTNALKTAKEAS